MDFSILRNFSAKFYLKACYFIVFISKTFHEFGMTYSNVPFIAQNKKIILTGEFPRQKRMS